VVIVTVAVSGLALDFWIGRTSHVLEEKDRKLTDGVGEGWEARYASAL
jgi:hypothetical protein